MVLAAHWICPWLPKPLVARPNVSGWRSPAAATIGTTSGEIRALQGASQGRIELARLPPLRSP